MVHLIAGTWILLVSEILWILLGFRKMEQLPIAKVLADFCVAVIISAEIHFEIRMTKQLGMAKAINSWVVISLPMLRCPVSHRTMEHLPLVEPEANVEPWHHSEIGFGLCHGRKQPDPEEFVAEALGMEC